MEVIVIYNFHGLFHNSTQTSEFPHPHRTLIENIYQQDPPMPQEHTQFYDQSAPRSQN